MELDKLTQQERLSILEELSKSIGWKLLVQELKNKKIQLQPVKNADTKEAFFFGAIYNQAIEELLLLPETWAGNIKRVSK